MTRAAVLVVVAFALAAASLWYFARLLSADANPMWHLLPGLGLALAYVLARAGLDARNR